MICKFSQVPNFGPFKRVGKTMPFSAIYRTFGSGTGIYFSSCCPSDRFKCISTVFLLFPVDPSTTTAPTAKVRLEHPSLSPLELKLRDLGCNISLLPPDTAVWFGNETHELLLPVTVSHNFFTIFITC